MQSRRPKPTKVGDKKSNEKPRSDSRPKPSTSSSPKFKKEPKESEEPSTFNYLRRTNETASKDRKRPSKYKNTSFSNSFGKQSDEVMERAAKRAPRGSKSTTKSSKYESSSRTFNPTSEPQKAEPKSENSLKPWQRRGKSEARMETEKGGRFANRNQSDRTESPDSSNSWDNKSATKNNYNSPSFSRKSNDDKKAGTESSPRFKSYDKPKKIQSEPSDESLGIRLNRFIANCGVCARREADNLIEAGEIYVNGKVMTDFSYRVQTSDSVKYGSKVLKREKYVYILLNKPKDFLTTTDDPEGRKSVMDLVKNATTARLYPVGRLDRNTTGLLLLTNDGDLTEKLMHPSHKAKKIYQVDLDKPFSNEDLMKVRNGVILEDGPMKADDVDIVSPDRKCVGIEIHSGRNRIVRRIFEHLGYNIERLDRVMYAGLTKKDLPRGTWRFLSEMEVTNLKYLRG